MPITAIVYARSSTAHDGPAIDRQIEFCRLKTSGMGAEIAAVFTDTGTGTTTAGSLLPGLAELLTYVENNPVDIVASMGSLFGDTDEEVAERLQRSGTAIVFCA